MTPRTCVSHPDQHKWSQALPTSVLREASTARVYSQAQGQWKATLDQWTELGQVGWGIHTHTRVHKDPHGIGWSLG